MNLLDLMIKVGVNDEATGGIQKIASFAKNGLSAAFKVGTAAIASATTAVGVLAKSAMDAYADYEQLKGGVETLFSNKDGSISASAKVMENAAKAYDTAGLSANQYMETVTSFSAALVSSLKYDYDKAADIADMALQDMADNSNKMGTDMASIQNAYQGFAKQNYTMLDNLKLGYGGTKQEMQRLLRDAQKLTGVRYNINNLSDVYEAIHAIQDELGITGTTADEAEKTISGSLIRLKASWQNLLVGFADDNADMDGLLDNVVHSAVTFFNNAAPRITKAVAGIGKAISMAMPIIGRELPKMFNDLLPALKGAVTSLVSAVTDALPDMLSQAIDLLPFILQTGVDLIAGIGKSLVSAAPKLLSVGKTLAKNIAEGISTRAADMADKASEIFGKFKDAIKSGELWEKGRAFIANLVSGITEKVTDLTAKGKDVFDNFISGIDLPALIEKGKEFISNTVSGITEKASDLFDKGKEAFDNFVSGIDLPALIEKGKEFIINVKTGITERATELVDNGKSVVSNFLDGIDLDAIVTKGNEIVTKIISGISGAVSGVLSAGADLVDKFFAGIGGGEGGEGGGEGGNNRFLEAGISFVSNIVSGIFSALTEIGTAAGKLISSLLNGIIEHIPELLTAGAGIIGSIIAGIGGALYLVAEAALNFVKGFIDGFDWERFKAAGSDVIAWVIVGLTNAIEFIKGVAATITDKVKEGISNGWEAFLSWVTGKWEEITSGFPSFTELGSKLIDDIKAGVSAKWESFKSWISGLWNSIISGFTLPSGDGSDDGGNNAHSGNFAIGMDYVPNNGLYQLHKGEAVLNRTEADSWRTGSTGNSGGTVNVYAQTIDKATMDYIFDSVNAMGGLA